MIGPTIYDRIDEMQRAAWLAEQLPDVQAYGQTLFLHDGDKVRHLHWTGRAWQCDCTYSRTHNLEQDPCRHVRALEAWQERGQLADPRLMILDETLFTGQRRFFRSDPSRQTAHDTVAEWWRHLAQDYARRQTSWDIEQTEAWYTLIILCLICPYLWSAGLKGVIALRLALTILDTDLPDWFDVLCEIKRAWMALLREPDWEVNLAFKEAFCDWLEEQASDIADRQIRSQVNRIGELIRYDLWSPYIWQLQSVFQIKAAAYAARF